jgi:hypothetical protein
MTSELTVTLKVEFARFRIDYTQPYVTRISREPH